MAATSGTEPERFGNDNNFWSFHPSTGWDLTRGLTPGLTLPTTNDQPITICPRTTALVVVDMQNFFLHPAAGRPLNPLAVAAEDKLARVAVPACRRAGIQVVHLTWGISDDELAVLPPTILRAFGVVLEQGAREVRGPRRVGGDMGDVKLENGNVVAAGRMLMRDQWNTELHDPLLSTFTTDTTSPLSPSLSSASTVSPETALPDVRFHKARVSGFSDPALPIVAFLRGRGITTLLFAGVNTDQCVYGSLTDAVSLGFDGVLLRDGCATGSPDFAREMVEFECRRAWGFVSSCEALREAVDGSSM